jgi:3-oxoacyl-[acyl-carrier protein] reductase
MIDPKLKNKVVFITGANHGIGAATAKALGAQGAKVFITYYIQPPPFSDEELAAARKKGTGGERLYLAMQQQSGEVVVNQVRSAGGIAVAYQADLGNTDSIPRLYNVCEKELGPVDIMIINHTHDVYDTFDPASVGGKEFAVQPINTDNIDRHLAVNARAGALLIKEYVQRYITRKADSGRIITLTTTRAHGRNISYAASKQALVSYSLSAAQELGKYGITVNVVCPGATQTGYISTEAEGKIINRTPLGRLGTPEDIADVIVFLASEQGHWITAQVIFAAGGFNVPFVLG